MLQAMKSIPPSIRHVRVVDSHTGGEPTRIVIAGGPDLGTGSLAERRERFHREHDRFRSAVVNEPRGSDVVVGALLCKPVDPACVAGVLFFNNVGVLNMCGHGTIGLVATMAHLGLLAPGTHRIETPVGEVGATLHDDGSVSVENVPSYREKSGVRVALPGGRHVTGDIAWGGNWFFLVSDHGETLDLANVEKLTSLAWDIRVAVNAQGFPDIDHVELFGPPSGPHADSRNFVLCPGKAYDRSPCGTGTSAKLACLFADGKLREGGVWRQESIVGSVFEGTVRQRGHELIPIIRGTAYVNAESMQILDERDPFCWGIR